MPVRGIPVDLTSFVGRSTELDQLVALMERSRLVTLTGPAGSGKTRLALELVRSRLAADGSVAWTELAALREPALVAPAVGTALQLHEEIRPGDVEGLARLARDGDGLLVLDNCEHLVDGCAELVDTLLRAAPGLRVLATSREALGVRGEQAWLVPPLSLPADPGADPGEAEAVRLFVERARDAVPAFSLTDGTAPAVVEICRRLDGIPLAIELAAARIRLLPPAEIATRLDDVFRILTDDRRTVVPRHRTLRAAIDWSHDLLHEPCRALLRRVAVFRGGFTLEAAEAVGPGTEIEAGDVLDLVGRLVDRSMLVVREQDGFARYHLLEAVRQYAAERLAESGEEAETRRRHAGYFLDRVEEAEPHFTRRERKIWVDRLQPEIDNLRSALEWTRHGDEGLHVRLVSRLWWFWFSTHHWTEGSRWIDGAFELPPAAEPGPDRAALLFAAGALAALQVRTGPARTALTEAASLAAALGDERLEAYATNYLGLTHAGEGRREGAELCRKAEAWFRAHEDLYGLRLALLLQGSTAMAHGDLDEAERLNREGVAVARRFGQDRELAVSLQNLAVVHIVQGRLDDAEALLREAFRSSRRDPSHYFIATGTSYLAEIEGRRGRPLEAARLFGAAESLREAIGARAFPLDARRVDALVPGLRADADEGAFEAAWAEGRALSPADLLEELASRSAADGATPAPSTSPTDLPAPAPAVPAAGEPLRSTQEPPALVVDALGRFQVAIDGEPIPDDRWPYGKPRELLVHLLLHPVGRTRDQIGEALWPGAPRSNLKNSFHVTLHHLRKALDRPEWVVVEGERYRLAPGLALRFDADRFEAEARAALESGQVDALRSALGLYRGELLEGTAGARWVEEHRDRLRRLSVELTLALGSALEETDPAAAAALYRALAAREELDEEVHRRLMTLQAAAGDRAAALRQYDRLAELLQSTLEVEPEPETRALVERLRAGQPVH